MLNWLVGACALLLFPSAPEHAAQLVLLAGSLGAAKAANMKTLYALLKAPLLMFLVVAVLFEWFHLFHNTKYRSLRSTWRQVERLREQRDLTALLEILLQRQRRLEVGDWQQLLSKA